MKNFMIASMVAASMLLGGGVLAAEIKITAKQLELMKVARGIVTELALDDVKGHCSCKEGLTNSCKEFVAALAMRRAGATDSRVVDFVKEKAGRGGYDDLATMVFDKRCAKK